MPTTTDPGSPLEAARTSLNDRIDVLDNERAYHTSRLEAIDAESALAVSALCALDALLGLPVASAPYRTLADSWAGVEVDYVFIPPSSPIGGTADGATMPPTADLLPQAHTGPLPAESGALPVVMSAPSVECPKCGRMFRPAGLAVHLSKAHPLGTVEREIRTGSAAVAARYEEARAADDRPAVRLAKEWQITEAEAVEAIAKARADGYIAALPDEDAHLVDVASVYRAARAEGCTPMQARDRVFLTDRFAIGSRGAALSTLVSVLDYGLAAE